jgi:hypothetical protein
VHLAACLAVAARCLLAVVFAVSAASKVHGPAAYRAFAASLGWIRPARAVPAVAFLLTAAEIAIPPLLLPARTALAGLALAGAVLALLAAGVALAVGRGLGAACRCFGAGDRPLRWAHAVRNAVLATVALIGVAGAAGPGRAAAGYGPLPAGLPGPAAVLAALAGVVGAAAVLAAGDIARLFGEE